LLKTVFATVIAWVLAVDVLHLSQAFMAPWAALLTVQATVFGTLRIAEQQPVVVPSLLHDRQSVFD
jgi:uncharacterized membrane protein YgaE (UPF0421/DUF939 family)